MNLQLNQHRFNLKKPIVMGVLNLTPDSFSDGGQYSQIDKAIHRVEEMIEQGAQIIDIGGESTRPGSSFISADEELHRIMPVIEALPKDKYLISVDTNKPEVQTAVLKAGVHIINDIMGGNITLYQKAEQYQAGLVLMHTSSTPIDMQQKTGYDDIITEIQNYFDKRLQEIQKFNLPKVWIDPGIGFGKTLEQNLSIMRQIDRFTSDDCGILLGTSRKSWIDKLYSVDTDHRLGASLASIIMGYLKGVEIFRVHDVEESVQALDVAKQLNFTS
ncbi:MAG: dihydropteroate synthase [Opitutaceae bacterium]|nr:dihydropteroate synthase [Opitutaceae bacterium]